MSVKPQRLKIGTRGSPLALTQTNMVRDALLAAHLDLAVEIVIIKTSGDWKPSDGEVRLEADGGGKALFAKEIEEAMLDGRVDAAVHSMKDMETSLPEGLQIAHMLPREDARDSFLISDLANNVQNINDLPQGAVVGSASVRRQAFLLAKRPDLKVVPLRGNVQTRIEKLRSGQVDATLLAMAGLNRLGLSDEADFVVEPEDMLPAAGQGAVGIETRTADAEISALFDVISCDNTMLRVSAERAVLEVLNASCHTPIGAYATLDATGQMHLRAMVAMLDGSAHYSEEARLAINSLEAAHALGTAVGQALKDRAPSEILAQIAS